MPFIRTLFSIFLVASSLAAAQAEVTLALSQSLSSPLPATYSSEFSEQQTRFNLRARFSQTRRLGTPTRGFFHA